MLVPKGNYRHSHVRVVRKRNDRCQQPLLANLGQRSARAIAPSRCSTAEKVSNVSGRGVGMNVVKTSIEKIGGSIDLQSQQGKGTAIKIKIPLTLATIPALILSKDGNLNAITQVNLSSGW